jgi:hypothetical protein
MSPIIFVILNSSGVPEVCDFERWERWFQSGGKDQMHIKHDLVNNWAIDTFFRGNSVAMEGPLPLWEVTADHPSRPAFLERFGTKEAALEIHEVLVNAASANKELIVSVQGFSRSSPGVSLHRDA